MAPSIAEPTTESIDIGNWPIPSYQRPEKTELNIDWAPLAIIDLTNFGLPGEKQHLANQLHEAVRDGHLHKQYNKRDPNRTVQVKGLRQVLHFD